MDIQVASNFERLLYDVVKGDGAKVAAMMESFKTGAISVDKEVFDALSQLFDSARCDDATTLEIIRVMYEKTGETLDPHTATAVHAATHCTIKDSIPVVVLATAHPAKFPESIIRAGIPVRAMGKIVQPIFPWSETVTLVALVTVVTVYASVGGIRGVIFTDLVQFVLGLFGSFWLAAAAWNRVGGRAGLRQGLDELYGADALQLTALFPDFANGWAAALGLGAFSFGAYLLVQSYANVPSDGGGYLQQRLNTTRSESDAQKAAILFFALQYMVRIWPWLVVALAALVIYPLGEAPDASSTAGFGALVAADREMAYHSCLLCCRIEFGHGPTFSIPTSEVKDTVIIDCETCRTEVWS
jgi:hypothetical protein